MSELKSLCARLQRDSDPALTTEVSWTQLQNRLQSFVDSPPHPHQLPSSGDPPGAGGVSKVEASTSGASTGGTQEGDQLSVGVSCEGGTPFSDAAVFVVPQRRGRRPGRGRGGRRGGATRGGRRGGRGRQRNPPTPQPSKKLVVGDGELVNLDMLGVLGLLGSDCAGPSGGVTREELMRAEEEESPLSSVPAESSASVEERQRVDGTVSGSPGTQEEGGADGGGVKNDEGDRRNDEGDRRNDEGDSRNEGDRRNDEGDSRNEGDRRNDEGDRSSIEGDRKNDEGDRRSDEVDRNNEDDKKSNEGDRQNDEDKKSVEAGRRNDEGDRRSDEGDRSNEDDRKSDEGDLQNDDVEKSDEADRQNDDVDRRNGEDDKIAGEDASKADQGDSSVGEGSRSDDGDAEDREGSDGKKVDSTVLMADSVGVAQELPVGEQHEEMVVTLSATATPPVGGRDPRTAALSKLEAASGVSGEGVCDEVRCEPPASKPGKRRGRPPKDDSKRKKTENSSGDVENGITAHVDQSGMAAAVLDTSEEVGGAPAPSQKGRRRKTISKLQSSFLPDIPAFAQVSHRTQPAVGVCITAGLTLHVSLPPSQPLSKAPFTWKGFRAPVVKCNPPKLLRIPKEQR